MFMTGPANKSVNQPTRSNRPLRVGFVPLSDCAPLVMAQELGLYAKYGLRVQLSREPGWASVREKILYGELDATHALAPMVFAASLGLGSVQTNCVTGLVLSLNGNAITLSPSLFGAAGSPRLLAGSQHGPLVFGVPFLYSSHHFLLRAWLRQRGLAPGPAVQLVVVPPPQMAANLKAGHLDGFCVGEPWNSAAIQAGTGRCAAASAELEGGHPEKILMVRRDFAEVREEEHLALVAALLEACAFCDAPEHCEEVIATLSRPQFVGVPEAVLRAGLRGPFDFGGGHARAVPDFCVFHRHDANAPSSDKAAWILQNLCDGGLAPDPASLNAAFARRVFRADIFEKALRLCHRTNSQNEIKTQSKHPVLV
jgi:two-component system, oxyanion-binding sensor